MPEHCLQQSFALTPTVCSRYLAFSLEILFEVSKRVNEAKIRWSTDTSIFEEYAEMIRLRNPLIVSGFCFVDGLNVPVNAPKSEDIPNAYYNGRTCSHYSSNVMAFAPDGSLIFTSVNAPRSWVQR
ncbi:unnamed protein product [Phytophthora fragariaefolia]|uniref:Unnamed protein product n=1 Tax=Phytophthora fragariaefolia TaxID=1490495 RepID=A0A9W6UB77_9STRA|nr:unnamed protein product [Phytophthora fragariaefolia]